MAFYGTDFIYDGKISSEYGLTITSMAEGSELNSGADVVLTTQEIYRRPKVYLLGVQQSPVLTIPIKINVNGEISALEDSVISSWLFGSMSYKKLQIVQGDMQNIYFNCIFTGKQTERVGNIIRGYTANIICDSPFAWEYPRKTSYTYSPPGYTRHENITIINTSDNPDYTYPKLIFTMNPFGGDLSIINKSDNDREFLIMNLPANKTITIDNDLQIITGSSVEENYLPNFVFYEDDGSISSISYNWLRFVQGENVLTLNGNISYVEFEHQCARKIS